MNRRLWAARTVLWALRLAAWLDPTYLGRLGYLTTQKTVGALKEDGWSVVKFDPATEVSASGKSYERPLVIERWEDRHAA